MEAIARLLSNNGVPDETIRAMEDRFRESGVEGLYRLQTEYPDESDPVRMAVAHAGLGQRDEAFRWLENAVEQRDSGVVYTKINSGLDSLRDDPRFDELLERLNFPE